MLYSSHPLLPKLATFQITNSLPHSFACVCTQSSLLSSRVVASKKRFDRGHWAVPHLEGGTGIAKTRRTSRIAPLFVALLYLALSQVGQGQWWLPCMPRLQTASTGRCPASFAVDLENGHQGGEAVGGGQHVRRLPKPRGAGREGRR